MAIPVECKQCGKKISVPDEFAGKRAKCKCGAVIEIPAAGAAAAGAAPVPKSAGRSNLPKPEPKAAILPKKPHGDRAAARGEHDAAEHHAGYYSRYSKPVKRGKGVLVVYAVVGLAAVAVIAGAVVKSSKKPQAQPAPPPVAGTPGTLPIPITTDEPPKPAAPVTPTDPMALLPADAKGIGFVNLKQLAAAGLLDSLAGALELNAMGINVQTDVDTAAVAFDKFGPGCANAMIVAGSFTDSASIYKKCMLARLRGARTRRYERDYALLTTKDGSKALSVMDAHMLAFGTERGVKRALSIYKGSERGMVNAAPLMARGKALAGKTFWFTADLSLPAPPDGQNLPDLSTVKSATISGQTADNSLALSCTLQCVDKDSAALLAEKLNSQLPSLMPVVAVLMGGDENNIEPLSALLASAKATAKGAEVSIAASLDADMLAKVKALKVSFAWAQEEPEAVPEPPKIEEKPRPKDDFDF